MSRLSLGPIAAGATPLSRWMLRLALLSHALLIAAIAWRADFGPLALVALPLLWPLPGMWRGSTYTCAWASMLLAFYAAVALANGYTNPGEKWLHFGIATLAALDFAGLIQFVRFTARERAANAAPVPPAPTAV